MIGKSLVELNIRAKYGCNVVAVKRGDDIIISLDAQFTIRANDVLIVIGRDEDISKFERNLVIIT